MFDRSCARRKWLLAIAAGALATFTAAQSGYAQGTWTTLAPVPSPTEGMTVGGVGKINIGAYGSSGEDTNLTRLYNITTDSWSSGASGLGSARSEAAYGDTTHAGFLYVIGGESGGMVQSDLQRYDPVTNTWTTLATMPTARAGAAAPVVDNGIFVIGGRLSAPGPCGGGPYLATVEKYDVDTDTWSAVAPLPSPRSDLAAVAHGGKVFVFGGCAGTVTDEVDMYDPQTNTWTTRLAPMPTARASLAAGRSGDRAYLIGGWDGISPSALNVNEVYDIAGNSWSANTPMPTARLKAGTRSHGGRIYVVGGALSASGPPTDAHELFKP